MRRFEITDGVILVSDMAATDKNQTGCAFVEMTDSAVDNEIDRETVDMAIDQQVNPVGESQWLTKEEMETVSGFDSAKRRKEWTEWHRLVRMEAGREQKIGYDRRGAPQLIEHKGEMSHISVSHSKRSVAVMLSKRACGIDIECLDRNFGRVAAHYINTQEQALAQSNDERFKATLWCAKEAFYKMCGRETNDYLRDMTVTSVDFKNGTLCATLYGEKSVTAHYFMLENEMLCWCMESD